MDKEMMRALAADGEKLRQLTGEDHGPHPVEPLSYDDSSTPLRKRFNVQSFGTR
jgi:hypothetical protein